MKSFIISMALAFSATAMAQTPETGISAQTKTKLAQELDYIGSLYGSAYAPKGWKETHLGWNLGEQMKIAHAKLAAAQNMFEARTAVADLIESTADYHVSYSFYSTEKASLPFQVKTVEGKTLIVHIDRTKLSETAFPFQVGDELLTMNQVPVAQILSELVKESGTNVPETDLALADLDLTDRLARRLTKVPHGPVTVSVKSAKDEKVSSAQLAWEYTPEHLNNWDRFFDVKRQTSILSPMMFAAKVKDLAEEPKEENTYGIGAKKPFLPDFGPRIWQTEETNTFDAYMFQNEQGQLVGVVRIFGYVVADYNKAVKDFAGIVQHFEKHAVALIIDQNNNPGGSVYYLYSLASMLSDQALAVPKHRVAPTTADAQECYDLLEKIPTAKNDEDAAKIIGDAQGYPATYQLLMGIQDYCRFVMREFQAGKKLSEPGFLWGVDRITPNPARFTKPIVILTNQLDFSGGDFFPAIMQDNKRATIVGTRTAGAGGYINQAQFPNSFGLKTISFTGSIAERVDKNPIENLGITPDVHVPMTVEDVRNGYKSYQKQVQSVVNGLVTK